MTGQIQSYAEAVQKLGPLKSMQAQIWTINRLLVKKGCYTQKEFDDLVIDWAEIHLIAINMQESWMKIQQELAKGIDLDMPPARDV